MPAPPHTPHSSKRAVPPHVPAQSTAASPPHVPAQSTTPSHTHSPASQVNPLVHSTSAHGSAGVTVDTVKQSLISESKVTPPEPDKVNAVIHGSPATSKLSNVPVPAGITEPVNEKPRTIPFPSETENPDASASPSKTSRI